MEFERAHPWFASAAPAMLEGREGHVAVEYLFVGAAVAAALGPAPAWRKVVTPIRLALPTPLGAGVGAVALVGATGSVLATVLAFGRWRSCTW